MTSSADNNNTDEDADKRWENDPAGTIARLSGVEVSSFSTLTKLDLPNCGLSSLPTTFPDIVPNLSILFMPKNNFRELPPLIGSCSKLQMVSFKDNGMESIHPDSLKPQLRWLILTGNSISQLPDTIGRCKKLQKLMLSGNRLTELPSSMEGCENLELVRLACNQLKEAPMTLLKLPNLRWVAVSNNPFLTGISDRHDAQLKVIEDDELDRNDWPVLGQGAGGVTRRVEWKQPDNTMNIVAIKTYSGELTSDGSPQDERKISMVASSSGHSCLIQLRGQTKTGALVMEYLDGYTALAGPPSFETCSRDVYGADTGNSITGDHAKTIAKGLLEVLIQLHEKGICHGDFYAHNILIRPEGQDRPFQVKLSDFGAAFFYDKIAPYGELIESIELRAFGVLLEELGGLIDKDDSGSASLLKSMASDCYSTLQSFQALYVKYGQELNKVCGLT